MVYSFQRHRRKEGEMEKGMILRGGLVFAAALIVLGGCALTKREQPGHAVSQVDLERYMGRWHEIASFPNWFQKGCTCTTAEYKLVGNTVSVTNRCQRGSTRGEPDVATATAYPVSGTNNSQLKVQFQWPFKGDYWIIALDDDYEYAMVGHPHMKYLWILSRSPEMEGHIYWNLVEIARTKGYDVDRLRKTDQSCAQAY